MELLDNFRKDKGYLLDGVMSLRELSEFTYWLFKYRVKNGDGARIASDTKQALNQLEKMQNIGSILVEVIRYFYYIKRKL